MTPLDRRMAMLRHNAHAVALYYWRARDAGTPAADMIVLVVDASEGFGLALNDGIREAQGPTQGFSSEQIAAHHARRMHPTIVAALPREMVVALFDEATPTIASTLRGPPPAGHVWVAVVAFGSTSLCAMPEPSRSPAAAKA